MYKFLYTFMCTKHFPNLYCRKHGCDTQILHCHRMQCTALPPDAVYCITHRMRCWCDGAPGCAYKSVRSVAYSGVSGRVFKGCGKGIFYNITNLQSSSLPFLPSYFPLLFLFTHLLLCSSYICVWLSLCI